MRIITFLLLLTLSIPALAQDSTKRYTFKEIGWTISLPVGFIEIDSSESNKKMERGKKILEESNGVIADIAEVKTLFGATKNTFQYLTATLTPFDPKKDGDYGQSTKDLKDLTYNTFKDQMPDAVLDSSTLKITIDGLGFDKFSIVIKVKDLTMTVVWIGKLYKGYDFAISYLYLDEKTKEQIEASINGSKFRK